MGGVQDMPPMGKKKMISGLRNGKAAAEQGGHDRLAEYGRAN